MKPTAADRDYATGAALLPAHRAARCGIDLRRRASIFSGSFPFPGVAMFRRLRRLFRVLSRDALVLWFACRDRATPKRFKLGALLLVLYVLSPVDLIPDTIPLFGWLDDAAVIAFLLPVLVGRLPAAVAAQAGAAADRTLFKWRFGLRRS